MGVQLIIDGNHMVDVITQVQQLANSLSGVTPVNEYDKMTNGHRFGLNVPSNVGDLEDSHDFGTEEQEVPAVDLMEEKIAEAPLEKLGRGEAQKAADAMIVAGVIDSKLFPLLSKAQQKRVGDALLGKNKPASVPTPAAEVEDAPLFGADEPLFEAEEKPNYIVNNNAADKQEVDEALLSDGLVTYDTIRDLLVEKCRDKETKKDDAAKYTKAADIIKSYVAHNQEPKISNVPKDKLKELYYALSVI